MPCVKAAPGLVTTVAAGGIDTCALNGAGVECWGDNDTGELGTPNQTTYFSPSTGPGVIGLSASFRHSHAWKADGTVVAWGLSSHGELGLDAADGVVQYVPKQVKGLAGVVSVGNGAQHGCALQQDGQVLCWGTDNSGNLGSPPKESCFSGPCNKTPVPVQF